MVPAPDPDGDFASRMQNGTCTPEDIAFLNELPYEEQIKYIPFPVKPVEAKKFPPGWEEGE